MNKIKMVIKRLEKTLEDADECFFCVNGVRELHRGIKETLFILKEGNKEECYG